MDFIKMHGIGNDYIYLNGFAPGFNMPEHPGRLAQRLADRHLGIGGDGLILVLPPERTANADIRMRIFNADGSEAEMCGNGIRCACKLAHDHALTNANPMKVQTGRGVLTLSYTTGFDGKVDSVTVDMGQPVLEADRIPLNIKGFAPDAQVVDFNAEALFMWQSPPCPSNWPNQTRLDWRLTCVSMGNPHAVFFVGDLDMLPLEQIGPYFEHAAIFPNRVNVHFVQVISDKEVRVRTWERGSGMTLACGTGASAVCVAGALTGRTDRMITAHLPGGDLNLHWRDSDNHLYMTGNATEVFTGRIDL